MAKLDNRGSRGAVFQGLVALAAVVVIIAGLKAASDILLPILFSVFLSIIGVPLVALLKRAGLPNVAAIPVVVAFMAGALVGVTAIVAQTVRGFAANIGNYEKPLNDLVASTTVYLEGTGIDFQLQDLSQLLQPAAMMGLLTDGMTTLLGVLSQVLIVVVVVTFILFEASDLELKFQAAFGTKRRPAGPFTDATAQVQRYLLIKTIASAITGVLITIGCTAIGLDFPVMWGLIAFFFNYVPSIGSIVAAIPPTLLATVQLGPGRAIAVAVVFLVVNVSIGNFLEPRFMGRSLGLSPLVVFLSLLFWGWVWGPVGMLFCIPMTVIAKLFLEQYPDTRWIAVFLGSPKEILEEQERLSSTAIPVPKRLIRPSK